MSKLDGIPEQRHQPWPDTPTPNEESPPMSKLTRAEFLQVACASLQGRRAAGDENDKTVSWALADAAQFDEEAAPMLAGRLGQPNYQIKNSTCFGDSRFAGGGVGHLWELHPDYRDGSRYCTRDGCQARYREDPDD